MCFVLRFDVFLCEKMLNTLKKYVLADSRGLLGVKVCLLLFSKSRSLSSRRKNASCHLVRLTAWQATHRWTLKYRAKTKSKKKYFLVKWKFSSNLSLAESLFLVIYNSTPPRFVNCQLASRQISICFGHESIRVMLRDTIRVKIKLLYLLPSLRLTTPTSSISPVMTVKVFVS